MTTMCDATLTQAMWMCSWLYFISPMGDILHQSQLICKSLVFLLTHNLLPFTQEHIRLSDLMVHSPSVCTSFYVTYFSLLTYRCGSCTQELEVFWGGTDFFQGHMGAWSSRRRSVPHRLDQEGREQLQTCTFASLLFVSTFIFIQNKIRISVWRTF